VFETGVHSARETKVRIRPYEYCIVLVSDGCQLFPVGFVASIVDQDNLRRLARERSDAAAREFMVLPSEHYNRCTPKVVTRQTNSNLLVPSPTN
jgi:hypothetical protein